jgi:O-antigen ligase
LIRVTLLLAVVAFLALYAWKDWYKSLCGLILLMAVVEHPDAPKTMFGVQGANPWNLLLLVVCLAWLANRRREGLTWDMPRSIGVLLLLYLGLVLIGFVRMMSVTTGLEQYTSAYLFSEYLVNTVKWTIPALLLFDGARSQSRLVMGLVSILGVYLLLSLQVIKWMPPGVAFSGDDLSVRSLKILVKETGYHRVNLSMMLAGASWAIVATAPLVKRRSQAVLVLAASLVVIYAQALTAGRMGYVTWAVLGLVLCLIRWRRYLPLVPLVILVIALVAPGVVERMFEGFSPETRDSNPLLTASVRLDRASPDDEPDPYTITAGRNVAWPYVIEKIGESPLIGFGRLAMQTTGLAALLWDRFRESFPHPHNAYLELLLDNGLLGFLVIVPFYLVVLARGIALFRDPSPLSAAVGGVACSLILALLIASFGSQTFYPREGSLGMWCAIGLMLRVSVGRSGTLDAAGDHRPRAWWQGVSPQSDAPHQPQHPARPLDV